MTLDYGTDRSGFPIFSVESLSGDTQIEVKYSEEFPALALPQSDGPWPFTVGLANVCHLERVPSAPNCKCEHQQRYPREYCPCGPAKSSVVQRKAKDGSADDLRNPVEHVVERSRADVEVREVHCIELVGVKPVGCEEHWEKKQDVGVGKEGLPQPQNLRLRCRILRQDYPRFVRAYYMFRVD